MARPTARNYDQIPLATFSAIDNYIDVDGILRVHEQTGNFGPSARLSDQLLRDDRIYGVLDTRIGGVLSAPLEVKPATAKRKAAKVAEVLGGVNDEPGIWDELFPNDFMAGMLRWGQQIGIAVADIFWEGSKSEWRPRMRLWHPQHIYWSWGSFSYWILTRQGVIELPRVNEQPQSDGQWVVWCPKGFHYGWMHGLVRPLAKLAIMRGWDYRDWSRYNEAHGTPMRKAIVPSDASEEVKLDFHVNVSNAGSDSTITVPQGAEGNKFDVGYVEAEGRSWEAFKDFKTALDGDMAVVVLGQNLPSESKGSGLGNGKAESFELVRADKRAEDARLTTCIRKQVLTWWARFNYGDDELAPRPELQVRPPEDENEEATALKTLGDAIQSLVMAGVPIDIRTLSDRAGVPMLSEEEQAEQDAEDAANAAAAGAAGAAGTDPADGAAGGAGGAAAAAATDKAPKKAAARAALVRSAAGKRRASRYVGQLEQKAKRLAAQSMRPNLSWVRAAVEHATSYDDLRARLVAAFGHMDSHGMATVLRKAHVMAQLAGRGEALAEV